MTDSSRLISPSPDVAEALAANRPVVALESTVISHGMPYPENLETALSLSALVRAEGAVPATIAVVDGAIKIGLSAGEMERLADGRSPVAKVSRRDLAICLAKGGLGATTVAATMLAASLAGIRVFATGGIGGVHRNATATFDISADITELSKTPVAVVCAGAKSVLDLGMTLEALETAGVPVLGFRADRFPAFYCRTSPFPVDARADTAEEVARICRAHWRLGNTGGLVIANPVPEAHALEPSFIEALIEAAVEEAHAQGITGKALTPFLLSRVNELTEGRALDANVALIRSNATLAGRIAVALG